MCYIIKRNPVIVFSPTKPPMNIRLWNVQTFEHLQRSLIRWLDIDILEGEKIRRIERLVTNHNQNGEVRFWDAVKTDKEVRLLSLVVLYFNLRYMTATQTHSKKLSQCWIKLCGLVSVTPSQCNLMFIILCNVKVPSS